MKNATTVNKMHYCYHCKLKGFFCSTPFGADYETCPCCGGYDFLGNVTDTKYDFLYDAENVHDIRKKYNFCTRCNIIYTLGCEHSDWGCTDVIYNCHFIKKWKNKVTETIYEGMPLFDNIDDWFNNANNVEVLELYCPHKNAACSKTRYTTNFACNLNII
jgi:hypothetical protein